MSRQRRPGGACRRWGQRCDLSSRRRSRLRRDFVASWAIRTRRDEWVRPRFASSATLTWRRRGRRAYCVGYTCEDLPAQAGSYKGMPDVAPAFSRNGHPSKQHVLQIAARNAACQESYQSDHRVLADRGRRPRDGRFVRWQGQLGAVEYPRRASTPSANPVFAGGRLCRFRLRGIPSRHHRADLRSSEAGNIASSTPRLARSWTTF